MLTDEELAKIEEWVEVHSDSRDKAKYWLRLAVAEVRSLRTQRDAAVEMLRMHDIWAKPFDESSAPGHCHERPGIWDDDNGVMAGLPCDWCAAWNQLRSAVNSVSGEVMPGGDA